MASTATSRMAAASRTNTVSTDTTIGQSTSSDRSGSGVLDASAAITMANNDAYNCIKT